MAFAVLVLGVILLAREDNYPGRVTATWPGGRGSLASLAPQLRLGGDAPDVLTLVLPTAGGTERVAVDLTVTSAGVMLLGSGVARGDIASVRTSPACHQAREQRWACHIAITVRDGPAALRITAEPGSIAEVSDLHVRRLKHTSSIARARSSVTPAILIVVLVVPLSWALRRRETAHNWLLAIAGASVLAVLQPQFALTLLPLLVVQYALGTFRRAPGGGSSWRLAIALGSVGALLVVAKYGVLRLTPDLAQVAGAQAGVALGASYIAIRLIDTHLRWHRDELRDMRLGTFLAYVLFPPTLPAGPIETLERFHAGRLSRLRRDDVAAGLARVCLGMAKKVILADYLLGRWLFGTAGLFDRTTLDPAAARWPVIAGALATSFLYAYADFSAYSDLAIGVARLCGHRIMENFNFPVVADGLRDFWRRWHISLSSWCMRNVYFPLVLATRRTYQPLFAVMATVGLWHSFSPTWWAWAMHHGAGLSASSWLERHGLPSRSARWRAWGRPLRIAATLTFVVGGHAFVLISDFRTALHVYLRFWTFGLLP